MNTSQRLRWALARGLVPRGGVDNIVLNAGAGGSTLATDDIGGTHYQIIKLAFGALDTATLVTASVGVPTDPLDRAARDMGKIDVALLDQYTPTDVDSGAGTLNALPIALYVSGAGGVLITGDAANGLDVDVTRVTGNVTVIATDLDIRNLVAATDIVDLGGNALTSLQLIDDVVHSGAAALSKYAVMGGQLDDTAPTTPAEDQVAAVRITSARSLHVAIQAALPAGTNNIGDVDVLSLPALPAGTNNIGDVDVLTLPALPAGTNNIGDVDVLTIIPATGATNLGKAEDAVHASGDTGVYALAVRTDTPAASSGTDGDYESLHTSALGGLWVTPTPNIRGGLSFFKSLDLDETEEEIKGTAAQLYGYYFFNAAAATRYLKFYNATALTVVVGTTVPDLTLPLPTGAAGHIHFDHGLAFGTALTMAATTGLADADAGAPAANDVIVMAFYK